MIITDAHLAKINADLGCELSPFELNNEFQHFGVNGLKNATKKPIWVIGKTWEYKGNAYFYLQYGDFRGGSKFQLASYDMKDQSPQSRKAHNEQVKEIEEKSAKEKAAKRQLGIDTHKPRFYACAPTTPAPHPYLEKKAIDKNYRARVDYRGTLLIPVEGVDEDLNLTFEGVQMIFRNAETNIWQKIFNLGLVKKGCFTRVTEFDVKKSEFIILAEGYATGCTAYMATGIPTVVAFDSGNLDTVIEKLKALNPDVKIIIAADDDFQTVIKGKQVNVGILKAINCQKKFQNVTYKKPRFANRIDETDFNDLHILEGLEVVKEQLKVNRAEFTDVILLGHLELKKFYYLCTQSKSIVELSASQHKSEHLKAMANEKYWAEKYGYGRNPATGDMFPNWNKISDALLERQRDIGAFDPKLIRGVGVWQDDGRVFVNYGQGVYKVQERVCVSNIDPLLTSKTKNFYNAGSGELVNFDDELSDEESLLIADAIKSLNFKSEYDYVFMIGFIAIANVFGALNWRPHLWLTAQAGSGKSWIMKKLRALLYFHIAFKACPSVAGVEQNVGNTSKVVVIDEAEASDRVDLIVKLARESSSNESGMTGKGSATGVGLLSEMSACFMMASVVPPHFVNKADDSRFFILDLESTENQSADEFKIIEDKFKKIEGFAQRLMVRCVNNIDVLRGNIDIANKSLRASGIKAREADQLAPVIAGFFLMFSRDVITKEIVLSIVNKMGLGASDYVERNEEKEDSKAYTALMQLQLNNQGETVAQALEKTISSESVGKTIVSDLESHGLVWNKKAGGLFIAANAPLLDRKMKMFGMNNFRKVLERSPCFLRKNVSQRAAWSSSGVAKGMLISVVTVKP